MSEKCLLDQWRDMAYDRSLSKDQLEKFWGTYFNIEKGIYEQLLDNPDEEVRGTVKELAEKYGQNVMTMVGFLDGINDSLKVPNPIETGCMSCRSGRRSLTRRQENVCTASRSSPEQSASRRRSEEMIRVLAEAAKNIRSAAEETHNR